MKLLFALMRGLKPIAKSLDSIAENLHILTRIQVLRLELEHKGASLPDPKLQANPGKDDMTEVSFDVKQPEIDPETGQEMFEEDAPKFDFSSIFGRKPKA